MSVLNPESKLKLNRNYGYEILINTFEPTLRHFLANEILLLNYGADWKKQIPEGVFEQMKVIKYGEVIDDSSPDTFLEETGLLQLKDILVFKNNFKLARAFLEDLSKEKFIELMDSLNAYRRKIAHAKSSFSEQDLLSIIEMVTQLSQGEASESIRKNIRNKEYTNARDVPEDFYEEYQCQHNLPAQDYDLEGGFVGREKDIQAIKKYLSSNNDRIITITGAGGVGKSSIALRVAYSYVEDVENSYEAILWFSAKTSRLTEKGIAAIDPSVSNALQLVDKILEIIDPKTANTFHAAAVGFDSYRKYLYNLFSLRQFLLIIDNLETVLTEEPLVEFVKDVPRPSQVLITSRIGLGELERRYPLKDLPEKDAIILFRLIAKERNRGDLLKFPESRISQLVKRVRCYPLLIKWAIGQVCLGREVDKAFSAVLEGRSEIAEFVFKDVFSLLTIDEKMVLYGMIVFGEKPIYKDALMQLSNLDEDKFEQAISRLIISSFIFTTNKDTGTNLTMEFSMLELTKGFVTTQFDADTRTKQVILNRYHEVLQKSNELERATSDHFQQEFLLGIKTREEKIAYHYVKTAKLRQLHGDWEDAEKHYQQATKMAPKLGYAFTEYSKFEFDRGHIDKGFALARKAVEVDPENMHAWLNLGISLRRWGSVKESAECLKKAKELDPSHLPIYNELGMAYVKLGEYEKADAELRSALKEEKYPNYRHKIISLQFRTINLVQWAKSCRFRRDVRGEIEKLPEAYKIISEAITTPQSQTRTYNLYREVCKEIGITLWETKGKTEGKPFLEKSLQNIPLSGNRVNSSNESEIAESNYFLAILSLQDEDRDLEQIRSYVQRGISVCPSDSPFRDKLIALDRQLSKTEDKKRPGLTNEPLSKSKPEYSSIQRSFGRIKYFNKLRKFGIIESSEGTYLFLLSRFRRSLASDESNDLEQKYVSYVIRKGPNDRRPSAYDVEFESNRR